MRISKWVRQHPRIAFFTIMCFMVLGGLFIFMKVQETQKAKVHLTPCTVGGIQGQCGTLAVYEDREAQSGRTINLNVIVIPAKSSPVEPDPFFYLAGGPGGGASQFIGTAASQFTEINQHRDLVYVDQRGTGQSNLLLCPKAKTGEAQGENIKSCLGNLPGDPRFYTTSTSMDDLEDVRQALGYDKINLYGMSYGVTAAQVYLNRHPEHVRSVILDHGSLLQFSFFDHWARSSQLGLERVFARCQASTACKSAYPDLQAEFAALVDQLAQPVPTGVFDSDTVQEIIFTRASFGSTIHYLLMDASTAANLPFLIHQAAGGDWSGLAKEQRNSSKAGSNQLRRNAMTLEILCHEPWWGGSLETINQFGQGSYYLDAALADYSYLKTVCSMLPDPQASAQHGPALPAEVPVLLFIGEIDPQDNLEGIAGYADLWPNSLLVIQPGVSHNFTPAPCWNTLMSAFIQQASVSDLPLACIHEYQAPAFKE